MNICEFLSQLAPLDNLLIERLETVLKKQAINKGAFLLKAGHVCDRSWFLTSGIARSYLPSQDLTTWFYLPGKAIYCPVSLNMQSVSTESIVAVEDCELIFIDRADLFKLYEDFPITRQMERKLYDAYAADIKDHNIIKSLPYEERLHWLDQHFDGLIFNTDCVEWVASFLSMSRSVYLKIKKERKNRNRK